MLSYKIVLLPLARGVTYFNAATTHFANGDLVLRDEDGDLVAAFASGQWESIVPTFTENSNVNCL